MTTEESDFKDKLTAVRGILEKLGRDAVVLREQSNFSWLTGGRGQISLASEKACCTTVISRNSAAVLTTNIEKERLETEELADCSGLTIEAYPWNRPELGDARLRDMLESLKCISEQDIEPKLLGLRTMMNGREIERYRQLCRDTAEAAEDVCRRASMGVSELGLAGELSEGLWRRGIEPVTVLIAFDERAERFRHPLPTAKRLDGHAFIGVCGRKRGLIASVSRMVSVTGDPAKLEDLRRRYRICAETDAEFARLTKPGAALNEVFEGGIACYARGGLAGEWKNHHQGGLTGYRAREIKASHESRHIIREGEVYAWNPTVPGCGCEDTRLVTADGTANMSHTGKFRYLELGTDRRHQLIPDIWINRR